jgi:hypothetical protein
VPQAAERPAGPADKDLQAVCRRCLDVLIGSSEVQVGALVRFADHPFVTGCCVVIEHVTRRPSSTPSTSLQASGYMGWLRDFSRGLPEEEQAARVPEARPCRALRSPSAAAARTASTVVEGAGDSTLNAHFGCALRAFALCVRALREPTSEGHCAFG